MFLGIRITLFLFPGSGHDTFDIFRDVGDLTEALACLTLLAVLIGIILLLAALCRRALCPEDEVVSGSRMSVVPEEVKEGAAEANEIVPADPVSNAAAEWDRAGKTRIESVITEVKSWGGGRRAEVGGVHGGPGKGTGRGGGRIGRERRRFIRVQGNVISGGVPEKLGGQGEDIKLEPMGVQGVGAANGVLGGEERPSEEIGCVSSGHGTGDYVSFKEVGRAKLR